MSLHEERSSVATVAMFLGRAARVGGSSSAVVESPAESSGNIEDIIGLPDPARDFDPRYKSIYKRFPGLKCQCEQCSNRVARV